MRPGEVAFNAGRCGLVGGWNRIESGLANVMESCMLQDSSPMWQALVVGQNGSLRHIVASEMAMGVQNG